MGSPSSTSPGFTRPYTYDSNEGSSPKRRFSPLGMGFRYDSRSPSAEPQQPQSPTGKLHGYHVWFPIRAHLKWPSAGKVRVTSKHKFNLTLSFIDRFYHFYYKLQTYYD